MLFLTDKDVTRCIAAIDTVIPMLERDRQLARASRDETIREFAETRAKLLAANVNAARDAKKVLTSV